MDEARMAAARDSFCELRRTLFRSWDRANRWSLTFTEHLSHCDSKRRMVVLGEMPEELGVEDVLVHEICHAIAGDSHGPKWEARMLKAADDAQELKMYDLSSRIMVNVEYTRGGYDMTPEDIYEVIETIARDYLELSLEEVLAIAATELGLPVTIMKEDYPRYEAAFDEARAIVAALHRARQRS